MRRGGDDDQFGFQPGFDDHVRRMGRATGGTGKYVQIHRQCLGTRKERGFEILRAVRNQVIDDAAVGTPATWLKDWPIWGTPIF
jgi:hypothetical protein